VPCVIPILNSPQVSVKCVKAGVELERIREPFFFQSARYFASRKL
jgi:hypothetical protein